MREKKLVHGELLQDFKEYFIDFLNLLFIKSKEGEKFFKQHIYSEIAKYYDYKINSYPPDIVGGGLLHALCFHFGVKIKIIDYPFFQNLESIFHIAHILEVHGFARTYDLDTSEIKQVCKRYK